MMTIDDNERFSNSMCSTQRHCRWRWCRSSKNTNSYYYIQKRIRPVSLKNGIFVLMKALLRYPLISVDAYFTSLHENRGLQVVDNPSIEPISSDQPTISAYPSRSFNPSPGPSKSQKPSISPSRGTSSSPSLRPTTAFPSPGATYNEPFQTSFSTSVEHYLSLN